MEKREIRIGLVTIIVILIFLIVPYMALANTSIIWQIGKFNNDRSEYEDGALFFEVYDYNIDTNPDDEISAPNCPGNLGGGGLNRGVDDQQWTAGEFNIIFSIDDNYEEVGLSYSRSGSEIDNILLDGLEITSVIGPGEHKHQIFLIYIDTLDAGEHVITLQYACGGSCNGHAIDALQLIGKIQCWDNDEDGYFDEECGGLDCDDADSSIYPDADDPCDSIDQDCDGKDGKSEICENGIDDDCDQMIDAWDTDCCEDKDEDGFTDEICGGVDCDDLEPLANPGMKEIQGDGIDNDCDGQIDEACFIALLK